MIQENKVRKEGIKAKLSEEIKSLHPIVKEIIFKKSYYKKVIIKRVKIKKVNIKKVII